LVSAEPKAKRPPPAGWCTASAIPGVIMRAAFSRQLSETEAQLLGSLDGAANALATVAAAVRAPTVHRTKAIADDAHTLRSAATHIQAELVGLTARQMPVATDLRLVLAMIEIAQHTALIGNQFGLIGQQLTAVNRQTPDPGGATDTLVRMSELASAQLRKATRAFATRDLACARELDADDDALDMLNRRLCEGAVRLETSAEQRELGLRYVLVGRSLERVGDNAVDIAEQAEFAITAQLREFSDASQPHR
jgi:phosphate transport system protein